MWQLLVSVICFVNGQQVLFIFFFSAEFASKLDKLFLNKYPRWKLRNEEKTRYERKGAFVNEQQFSYEEVAHKVFFDKSPCLKQ